MSFLRHKASSHPFPPFPFPIDINNMLWKLSDRHKCAKTIRRELLHPTHFSLGWKARDFRVNYETRWGYSQPLLLTAYEFNPGGIWEMTASLFRSRLCGLLQQLYPSSDSFEFMLGGKTKMTVSHLRCSLCGLLQQLNPYRWRLGIDAGG